jgi:hypothetical protein
MTQVCEEQRLIMVAYMQDELAPLERTRFESHIAHCRRCHALNDELSRGFSAAKSWSPKVSEEHLDRLVDRLQPYMTESKTKRSFVGFSLGFAAAAAVIGFVIAAVVMMRVKKDEHAKVEVAAQTPAMVPTPPVAPTPPAPVSAQQPTPHIKMVTSADWEGEVQPIDAIESRIAMTRGFAVVEFEGGQGRKLTVNAPGVAVEVVGTLFFVEVVPERQASIVGVKKGRVRVVTRSRNDQIDAGTSRAYRTTGELETESLMPRASIHVEDPYFAKPTAVGGERPAEHESAVVPPPPVPETAPPPPEPAEEEVASKEPPAKKSRSVHKKPHHAIHTPSTSLEGTHLLARAEELARKGQTESALEIYQRIREDDRAELVPYRAVASYETARLYGFVLKRAGVAEQMFRELARTGSGEVATQAGFALCELDLSHDRCLAAQCLRRMADGSNAEVDAEARQLLGRWGLDDASLSQCP